MSRPTIGNQPDCGKQEHLWTVPLKRGEKVVCRRCGKTRRGKRLSY